MLLAGWLRLTQRRAHIAILKDRVKRLAQAGQQQLHFRIRARQRGRKADRAVGKGAEHDAGVIATPEEAIRAATVIASEHVQMNADIGTLEAGKYGDMIAVMSDPLKDIRTLESVGFVMKGGTIYKQ